MKTFLVSYDVCFAIIICESKDKVIHHLQNDEELDGNAFSEKNGKIYHRWSSDYSEECQVEELSSKTGVVFGGAFG